MYLVSTWMCGHICAMISSAPWRIPLHAAFSDYYLFDDSGDDVQIDDKHLESRCVLLAVAWSSVDTERHLCQCKVIEKSLVSSHFTLSILFIKNGGKLCSIRGWYNTNATMVNVKRCYKYKIFILTDADNWQIACCYIDISHKDCLELGENLKFREHNILSSIWYWLINGRF